METAPPRARGLTAPPRGCGALVATTLLLATLASAWTFAIKPLPYSDWAYYWDAARGAASYERGGVLLAALGALQALALPPYAAALAMNLAAAFAILWLAFRTDGARFGATALPVAIYLLAITPYFAVVQLDLASTALLCAGLCLLAGRAARTPRPWTLATAIALVAFAVSSRPQFLLVLLAFATLLACAGALIARSRTRPAGNACTVAIALAVSALLGFAIDSGLRASAGRTQAVRTNSAVTLYSGLLSSGTSRTQPPACGHWSAQATQDARADARLPLAQAVTGRLQAKPMRHWLAVVWCKVPNIVLPAPYALSWTLDAPNALSRTVAPEQTGYREDRRMQLLRIIDRPGYRGLLVLLYAFTALVVARRPREQRLAAALPPVLWITSYWLVHAIFEIQGRYFLSLFLLLPFMASPAAARLFERGKTHTPDPARA